MSTNTPAPAPRPAPRQPPRKADAASRRWRGRAPFAPLARWEIALLAVLALVIVAFAGITLMRSAYMARRMTDAGVYFRAAWALRVGIDPYQVRDNNWWTYLYPPPLAVATMPLADPPDDAPRHSFLPYPVSVVIWYALGVLCLAAAAHWLASALEATAADPRVRTLTPRHRRWWIDRTLPMLVCLPAIGSTITRGQVNLIMVAAIGAMGATLVGARLWARSPTRNAVPEPAKPGSAGAWLALAACVKMYPAFLALHAIAMRRWAIMPGALVGAAALLIALPAVVLGPTRMGEVNRAFVQSMLMPQLGLSAAEGVDKVDELQRATGNQSFMAIIHGTRHLAAVLRDNKIAPIPEEKAAHLALSVLVTAITFAAMVRARRRSPSPGRDDLIALGTLAAAMLPISPVCHNHYFALHMPLVAALIARRMDRQSHVDLDPRAWTLIALYLLGAILPRLPGCEALRPLGVSMYAGLALWALGVRALWLGEAQTRTSGSSSSLETSTSSPGTAA